MRAVSNNHAQASLLSGLEISSAKPIRCHFWIELHWRDLGRRQADSLLEWSLNGSSSLPVESLGLQEMHLRFSPPMTSAPPPEHTMNFIYIVWGVFVQKIPNSFLSFSQMNFEGRRTPQSGWSQRQSCFSEPILCLKWLYSVVKYPDKSTFGKKGFILASRWIRLMVWKIWQTPGKARWQKQEAG